MVCSVKCYKEIKSDKESQVFSWSSEKAGDSFMRSWEKNPEESQLRSYGDQREGEDLQAANTEIHLQSLVLNRRQVGTARKLDRGRDLLTMADISACINRNGHLNRICWRYRRGTISYGTKPPHRQRMWDSRGQVIRHL